MKRFTMLSMAVVVLLAACASGGDRRSGAATGDRSEDPEFRAATEAADREFESQTAALEAGVYETFVHPDSIGGGPPAEVVRGSEPGADVDRSRGDPSTEALLGTLGAREPYNAGSVEQNPWTLQVGAYSSETGAFVRVRQIQAAFPDEPTWFDSGEVYRVYIGRFPDRASAERFLSELSRRGFEAFVSRAR